MQPFASAALAGHTSTGVALTLDAGWQCRIFALSDHVMRVVLIPEGGLREPRTWAIAPGAGDAPWEGRDLLDVSGFDVLSFEDAAGTTIAEDRPTHAYQWSARTGVVRHSTARSTSHQYFGLGDKTGPLDKHGRRFRTLALDALGYDAQTSDPLYKHWPFLIQRDATTGIA